MADPTDDPEAEPTADADRGLADDVPPLSEAARAALAGALPNWDLMPGDAVAR